MRPVVLLIVLGLAVATTFAQSRPKERAERPRADVQTSEWRDRACTEACCLGVQATGQWLYAERERSLGEIYVLEGLGAFALALPCAGLGGAAFAYALSASPDEPNAAGLAVAAASAVVLPMAAGFGAIGAGRRLGEFGSGGWAIGGAYAGAVVGAGLAFAGFLVADHAGDYVAGLPFYIVGGLAVPVGAVVGYNSGVVRETGPLGPDFGGRIGLPAAALTSAELPDHSVEYGMKVQFAGLRF